MYNIALFFWHFTCAHY